METAGDLMEKLLMCNVIRSAVVKRSACFFHPRSKGVFLSLFKTRNGPSIILLNNSKQLYAARTQRGHSYTRTQWAVGPAARVLVLHLHYTALPLRQ